MAATMTSIVRRDLADSRKFADFVYHRLFELPPDAQSMFPSDIEGQQLKSMGMTAAIVSALDKHEPFRPCCSRQ